MNSFKIVIRSKIYQLTSEKWLGFWLLLPAILFLPGISDFAYPGSGAPFSDMVLAHYPYALIQKTALFNEGHFRFWSPLIFSGAPLIGNPLAGLWYPPGWLVFFLPIPLGFNLLIILHLLWGGVGMHHLLRLEGLSHHPALFGAFAFMLMPKIFAHYGAGHVSLLYAVSWTPWLLYAARCHLAESQIRFSRILEALVFALICLADIRWSIYAGLAWWSYSLAALKPPGMPIRSHFSSTILHLLKQSFLACLLSAVFWLPMLEFTRLSTRADLSLQDNLAYSLPLARLIGLVFPDLAGFHEWTIYPGVIVFILSLLGVCLLWSQRMVRFWFFLWLAALIIALGDQLPGLHLIFRLPGFSLIRVPPRVMFLGGMALAALGAFAVQFLPEKVSPRNLRWRNSILLGLCSFMLLFVAGIWLVTKHLPTEFLWGAILAFCGGVWIWIGGRSLVRPHFWFLGLLGLCLLDWMVIDQSLFIMRSKSEVFTEGANLAEDLAASPGRFRLYSPSYSIPQQAAANFKLELADGIDPLQLREYVGFMQEASGVPAQGYSVTIPPFQNGDPHTANAAFIPDARLLGLLNVRYVASEFDLAAPGLVLSNRVGETRLYENQYVLPRAWMQSQVSPVGRDISPVEIIQWNPERIEIEAPGPGMLVLSEIDYPGWEVKVDGETNGLLPLEIPLRAVSVPAGTHQVIFDYQPFSLYLGGVLSLIGLALSVFYCYFGRK